MNRRQLLRVLLSTGVAGAGGAIMASRQIALWARTRADDPLLASLDPSLRDGLQAVPSAGAIAFLATHARFLMRQERDADGLPAPAPRPSERMIDGPLGPATLRLILIDPAPAGDNQLPPRPALLHIHGGGFIGGAAAMNMPRLQNIASSLNCLVASVEYRLAPETAYPGPVEDCYAALWFLHLAAQELRIDRARIAVQGESAGGGLAALVAIKARDRGEIRLAQQILIYPMLDDRTGSIRAVAPPCGHFVWNSESNRVGWTAFLGARAGGSNVPAAAVPARLADLRGLAPAFIGVGGVDLFAQEDAAYAARLRAAGVECNFIEVPGAYHGFDQIVPQAAISQQFETAWVAALQRRFA